MNRREFLESVALAAAAQTFAFRARQTNGDRRSSICTFICVRSRPATSRIWMGRA